MEKAGRMGQTIVTVGGGVISGSEVIKGQALNVSQTYQYAEPATNVVETQSDVSFSSPAEFTPMSLEAVDPLIVELKDAITNEPSLTPRDRIKSMSVAEELRWALVSPSPDHERIAMLERQVSSIGSRPAQVMSDIRKKLGLT
jgi:hypothetical protein